MKKLLITINIFSLSQLYSPKRERLLENEDKDIYNSNEKNEENYDYVYDTDEPI